MKRLSGVPELVDQPDTDPGVLRGNLQDYERVNRLLGGTRAALSALQGLLEEDQLLQSPRDRAEGPQGHAPGCWDPSPDPAPPVQLLDIGTGAADIPRILILWARRRGVPIRVVALDSHPGILSYARARATAHPELQLVRAEAGHLPFRTASFDYVLCTATLHHFDTAEATALLREMGRLARRGVIVSDLVRSCLGWAMAWLVCRLGSRNLMTRYDGPLSMRRAYTPRELRRMAETAGLGRVIIRRQRFFRMTLTARPGSRLP